MAKKLLAVLLVIVMAVSFLPLNVLADFIEPAEEPVIEETSFENIAPTSTELIPIANRAVGFVYMYNAIAGVTDTSGTTDWGSGWNQLSPGEQWINFDITQHDTHVLTLSPVVRDGTGWVSGNTRVHFLRPQNLPAGALDVTASIAVNGEVRLTNLALTANGSFWNNDAATVFGSVAQGLPGILLPGGATIGQNHAALIGAGLVGRQYSVTDAQRATLGATSVGDIITIIYKVGDGAPVTPPTPDEDIGAVKTAIEGLALAPVDQADISTEPAAKAYVEGRITALNLRGVTATVTTVSFLEAIAGNETTPAGVNGSYTFKVDLFKEGGSPVTTIEKSLAIFATVFNVYTYTHTWVPAKQPFGSSPDRGYRVNRVMPANRTQAQMNADVVQQFAKLIPDFVTDPNLETITDPEKFRMVIYHDAASWADGGEWGPWPSYVTGANNTRRRHVTVSESMGYGMMMLAYMGGIENELVNMEWTSQTSTRTGSGMGTAQNGTMTVKDALLANLPPELKNIIDPAVGVDIKFYFDALFRTLRDFPTWDTNIDRTLDHKNFMARNDKDGVPISMHGSGSGPDKRTFGPWTRGSFLMAWELSAVVPWNTTGNAAALNRAATAAEGGFYSAATVQPQSAGYNSHSVATDGDMDMAYGLLIACGQWGCGQPTSATGCEYCWYARGMINDLWLTCVDWEVTEYKIAKAWEPNYHLKTGNWAIDGPARDFERGTDPRFNNYIGKWWSDSSRPSDHMMQHLYVFAAVDPGNGWKKTIDATYEIQRQISLKRKDEPTGPNGLLADFMILDRQTGIWEPAIPGPVMDFPAENIWNSWMRGWLEGARDGTYSWNSCRQPWRLATGIIHAGGAPSENSVTKALWEFTERTHSGLTTSAQWTAIRGRNLDGTTGGNSTGTGMTFYVPFLVPAIVYGTPAQVQPAWDLARNEPRTAGAFYGAYINQLVMITGSGNWWSPTVVPASKSDCPVCFDYNFALGRMACEHYVEQVSVSSGNRRYGADIILFYDAGNTGFASAAKTITVNGVAVAAEDFTDINGKIVIDKKYFTNGFTNDRFCPDFVKFDIFIKGGSYEASVKQYVNSKFSENLMRNGDFTALVTDEDNGWIFNRGGLSATGAEVSTLVQNSLAAQRLRLGTAASNLGTAPRDIQLYQDVVLEAGKTYTGYFTVRVTPARSITVEIGTTEANGGPAGGSQIITPQVHSVANNTWVTYKYDIPAQSEDKLVRVNILLGRAGADLSGDRDVFVHNFRLVETVTVPVYTGAHINYGGWWMTTQSIVDTKHPDAATEWEGIAICFMDFDLFYKPGARLYIEYTRGTNALNGLLVRNITQSGTGSTLSVANGSGGRGESIVPGATGNVGIGVFTGESIIGHAASSFVDQSFSWLNLESNVAETAQTRFTTNVIYLTYFDVEINLDTVFAGIEMAEPGKVAYNQGEPLDLNGTYYYQVFESGRRERVQVTSNMIVGFASAVTGERTVTVVYPNNSGIGRPYTTDYKINVTGTSTAPAAKRPFPQAGNAGLAQDLLLPTGKTQQDMNADVIARVRMMIDRGEFLIDPATATNPATTRIVLDHNASGTGTAGQLQTTCSESMGYGMLTLALMAGADEELGIDVKHYFDSMFRSIRHWPQRGNSSQYLMAWQVLTTNSWKTAFGGPTWVGTGTTATDGSLDMAYAMVLASQQWETSDDGFNYAEYALGMIKEIWREEVNTQNGHSFLNRGSWDGSGGFTRPSDHMMHHLKVFAVLDPDNDWRGLINDTYNGQLAIMNTIDPPTGLLPDFSIVNRTTGEWTTRPHGTVILESIADGSWHWNACRVPWRLGVDTLFSYKTPVSDLAVKRLNELTFGWSGGDFNEIYGRQLDGTVNDVANSGLGYTVRGSAFSMSLLVPAAIYGPQEWFDAGWEWARELPWNGDKYGDYLTVLAMIAASGNEWSPVDTDEWLVKFETIEMAELGKTEYAFGEELDLEGFEITIIYNNPYYNEVIPVTADMVSGFKVNKAGTFTITVTFREATVTFTVTVAEPLNVQQLRRLAPIILKQGLTTSQLHLSANNKATLTLLLPGMAPIVLSTNANNRNVEGIVDLGNGYFLRFDIKGNGSNVKTFEIVYKK